MSTLSMCANGNVQTVADWLSHDLQNSAVSCTLVDKVTHKYPDTTIILLVFEKYYMRSSNRASLSVCISNNGPNVIVDAIASGGGQGIFTSFSWGA